MKELKFMEDCKVLNVNIAELLSIAGTPDPGFKKGGIGNVPLL